MPSAVLAATLSSPTPASASASITYTKATGDPVLTLTGSGMQAIDLSMMPAAGLRGLHVSLDLLDGSGVPATAAITLTWTSNSLSKSEEVSPGGVFALASPTPTHGVTALSVTWTAPAVVRVSALG